MTEAVRMFFLTLKYHFRVGRYFFSMVTMFVALYGAIFGIGYNLAFVVPFLFQSVFINTFANIPLQPMSMYVTGQSCRRVVRCAHMAVIVETMVMYVVGRFLGLLLYAFINKESDVQANRELVWLLQNVTLYFVLVVSGMIYSFSDLLTIRNFVLRVVAQYTVMGLVMGFASMAMLLVSLLSTTFVPYAVLLAVVVACWVAYTGQINQMLYYQYSRL